jgi:hypothetical protein
MDSEKELLDAFEEVIHKDFPNSQRLDCPGRDVLLKLAQWPADAQLARSLAHIRECAPCFDELKELRQKKANSMSVMYARRR